MALRTDEEVITDVIEVVKQLPIVMQERFLRLHHASHAEDYYPLAYVLGLNLYSVIRFKLLYSSNNSRKRYKDLFDQIECFQKNTMNDKINNKDYTWTTEVREDGTLDIFLDGDLVTNLQVLRDTRETNVIPHELHLYARKQETIKSSNGKNDFVVRTYGHGQH